MKKKILILVAIAFVCTISIAHASLIGIQDYIKNYPYPGPVPDILYDSGGYAEYTAASQTLFITGGDKDLYLTKPSDGIDLQGKVDFNLQAVFSNGQFQPGPDSWMIEWVIAPFEITWERVVYSFNKGDLFLAAYLTNFGWDEVNREQFDYTTQNYIYGALSENAKLWPVDMAIGGYVDTAFWPENWVPWGEEDLLVAMEKGNKVPVPEPTTMLLLGSGLIGLAGYMRKKFFKK